MSIKNISESPLINIMGSAAMNAAKGLLRDFGELEHLQISRKGLGDFVSAADQKCEKVLITDLSKAKPDYNFITEESGVIENSDSDFCWIIDPIDGTSNFLHAIPHFAIAIALKRGKDVIAALTYDPMKDEMFWAEKGKGAYLNKRRIRVSNRKEFDTCIVSLGWLNADESKNNLIAKLPLFDQFGSVRQMGSAALDLAYVASGRLDAYVFNSGLKIWDIAGGILMVKEALGTVTEVTYGKNMIETGSILAANQHVHQPLHRMLNDSPANPS
ncbi:MAG: inositol monophosphatase [Proteobacteria bacterium]|nr:inositol monophosphatase [Pseudomonadota bacterium]